MKKLLARPDPSCSLLCARTFEAFIWKTRRFLNLYIGLVKKGTVLYVRMKGTEDKSDKIKPRPKMNSQTYHQYPPESESESDVSSSVSESDVSSSVSES